MTIIPATTLIAQHAAAQAAERSAAMPIDLDRLEIRLRALRVAYDMAAGDTEEQARLAREYDDVCKALCRGGR